MDWKSVNYVVKEDDQMQDTCDKDGNVKTTVIRTIQAVAAARGSTSTDARTASKDGVTVPTCGTIVAVDGIDGYTVDSVQPRRSNDGPDVWFIRIQWSKSTTAGPLGGGEKWNVNCDIDGEGFTEDAYEDADGNPIQNTAGQAFDPPPKDDYYDEKITITYNSLIEQSEAFAPLRGKVNSADCELVLTSCGIDRSFAARTLRCKNVKQSNGNPLSSHDPTFKVSIELLYRAATWDENIRDKGYSQLNDAGERVNIGDANGEPVSQPVDLDGNGKKNPENADPVFLTKRLKKEADLSPLFGGLS